jgi:hypothetical protein
MSKGKLSIVNQLIVASIAMGTLLLSSCSGGSSASGGSTNPVTPTITWNPGVTSQIYGMAIGSGVLDATTNGGSISYSSNPSAGTCGTTITASCVFGVGTYTLTATTAATSSYTSASSSITYTVTKGVPTISWSPSVTIQSYGIVIGTGVLDAYVSGPIGSIAYTANTSVGSCGTVITSACVFNAGSYTLTATFSPTDATDYSTANTSINYVVTPVTPTAGAVFPNSGTYEGSIDFPAGAGVIDVTAAPYSADKTGVNDATAAINAAINAAYSGSMAMPYSWEYPIVYFPNGTYLVSGTLLRSPVFGSPAVATPDYGMELVGQSMSGVNIKLAPGTFASSPGGAVIYTQQAPGTGASAFHNIIENLTITIGTSNAYASGISYLANNMGAIRNVTINGDQTATSYGNGVDMTRVAIGPGLLENVTVNGFNYGIRVENTIVGITVEHISLIGQTGGALVNTDNLVTVNALYTSGPAKPIINWSTGSQNNGMIILNGSSLNQTGTSSNMVTNQNQGAIVFHSTTFSTPQCFTSTNCAAPLATAEGILVGDPAGTFTWTPNATLPILNYTTSNPAVVDTPVPAYDASSKWVAPALPASSGNFLDATGPYDVSGVYKTKVDATTVIQNALSSGASTIYLPHGVYYISAPLVVPATVNRIVGMNSSMIAYPGTTWPTGGEGMLHIYVAGSSTLTGCPTAATCPPLVVERLQFINTGSIAPYSVDIANASTNSANERDVVLRDIGSGAPASLYRAATGGRLFLEDAVIGTTTIYGTNIVEGRHWNTEATDWNSTTNTQNYSAAPARINNYGAPLWIFGIKTEGPENILNSSGSGTVLNEIIGGYFYTAPSYSNGRDHDVITTTTCVQAGSGAPLYLPTAISTPAMFIAATGSVIEASFVENVTLMSQTPTQTTEERSFPFYYVLNGTNCQAGAGYNPPPANGTIQRGIANTVGEAGFLVPYLITH